MELMGYQETEREKEGELAEGWRNISLHQLLKIYFFLKKDTLRKADKSELSTPHRDSFNVRHFCFNIS